DSRSVVDCKNLINKKNKKAFTDKVRSDYDRAREAHLSKRNDKKFVTIQEARRNRFQTDWVDYVPPKPAFLGTRSFNEYPLEALEPYIDWTPFFHTWELHGSYPRILTDKVVGEQATVLFEEAQRMLRKLIDEKRLTANA